MAKLTATEFNNLSASERYSVYDSAFAAVVEARSAQANALTAQASVEAEKSALVTTHTTALAAKDTEKTQATTLLQEKIDSLTAMVTDRDSLANQVNALTAANTALAAQLVGSSGDYKITVPAVVEVALQIEAQETGKTTSELLSEKVLPFVRSIAESQKSKVFALAMGQLPTRSQQEQFQILQTLGLAEFAAVPLDLLMTKIGGIVQQEYEDLDREKQTEIMKLLGLA
jgi:hypothetical protein